MLFTMTCYPRDATRKCGIFAVERWLDGWIIPFFSNYCAYTPFQGEPHQRGRKIHGVGKILQFSTEIAVYLGNGARYGHDHSYYGKLIGSHSRRIDPCCFRWPWVTFDSNFKFMTFSKSKGTKLLKTLIGNHAQPIKWYHCQWPWVTSDPDFKITAFFYNVRQ